MAEEEDGTVTDIAKMTRRFLDLIEAAGRPVTIPNGLRFSMNDKGYEVVIPAQDMDELRAALTAYTASQSEPSFGPLDPAAMDLGTWTPDAAPDDVVERVARAILSCVTPDDEGDMPPVSELLGFSGENKTRMVGLAAARAALSAMPAQDDAAMADLALDYLHLAQPEFCSARCPSVGREGVPIPHLPECISMRSLLDGLPFATPGATISTGLIAKLKKLANYLTEQGEYEACELIDTVVDRLSATLPQAAVDGWRPIESAPKDGTRVLLWMEPTPDPRFIQSDGPMAVCASYVVWSDAMKREGMRDGWSWYGPVRCHPTHWRPLPAPPAPAQEPR